MPQGWPLTGRRAHLDRLGAWYADRSVGGVVLTGPAGVGKTRLGEEALAAAAPRPTARVVGHPATQSIPLGALAHLLPADLARDLGDGDDDRAALFHRARLALRERAGDGRLLLLLDDADQLDDTSLALLLPLSLEGAVFPIATIRAGRPLPAVLASLAKDGHLVVETVGALSGSEVVTLLHRALDGPVDSDSVKRLGAISEGNLQVLSELVRQGLADGSLRSIDGTWTLVKLPSATGLSELMSTHLAGLDAEERHVVEVLAVAGTLGITDVEALADADALERLEARDVVRVRVEGSRVEVALTHPMYGELIRDDLPVLRTRSLQRRLADRLERHGIRRREDLAKLAQLRLAGGGEVAPEILIGAARLALLGRDTATARAMAEAAATRGSLQHAARVLAEVAVMRADLPELEELVTRYWTAGELDDDTRVHLARRLSAARFAAGDFSGAMDIARSTGVMVADDRARASMVVQQAALLANAGRPLDALEAMRPIDEGSFGWTLTHPRVRTELAAARSIANITLGRYDDAIDAARAGMAAQRELPEWLARRGMAAHVINEAHALQYAGHYDRAEELVESALVSAEHAGALAAQVWMRITLGEVERDRGRGRPCVEHFTAATELAVRAGQQAALVWAVVGIAQGHLLCGDLDRAEAAIDRADTLGHSPVATSWGTRERTRALLWAERGRRDDAVELLDAVADVARRDGTFGFESTVRYDLVRLDHAPRVIDRLTELTTLMQSRLVVAMQAHAHASCDPDPQRWGRAVGALEATGALLFAAECATEAAAWFDDHGDERAAAAMRQRVARLVEEAGGVTSSRLRRAPMAERLTPRERQVAMLAANGATSRTIAERLFVSKRTVDAHLDRIYRKLGVRGRAELGSALEER